MKRLLLIVCCIFISSCGVAETRPSWLQLKDMPVFDIRQYGAKAGDGANDSSAINAAIIAARDAGGGEVLIPSGEFTLATPAFIGGGDWAGGYVNINIRGAGYSSILQTSVATDAIQIFGDAPIDGNYDKRALGITISNIQLRGMGTTAGAGINASGTGMIYIDNVRIGSVGKGFKYGASLQYTSECFISKLNTTSNEVGLFLTRGTNSFGAECLVRVSNSIFAGNTSDQVVLAGVKATNIKDSTFSSGDNVGIKITQSSGGLSNDLITIEDNFFESTATGTNIYVAGRTDQLFIRRNQLTYANNKIVIASGAGDVSVCENTIHISPAGHPAISILATQDSQLRLIMRDNNRDNGNGKGVVAISISDARIDTWHFETLPDSNFGVPLLINPNFYKGRVGWQLGYTTATIASAATYNYLDLAATASHTQAIAYIPFTTNYDDYGKTAFFDVIINADSTPIAQYAVKVLVSNQDGSNLRASTNVFSVYHQSRDSSLRLLGTCALQPTEILRGLALNNSDAPGEHIKCTYAQLYCMGKTPQTSYDWWDDPAGSVASPTFGFWSEGDRVYIKGRYNTPVTTGGYLYANGTWRIFQ